MTGARTSACEELRERFAQGLQAVFRHRFYVTHRAYLQVTWTRSRNGGIHYTFAVELPSLRFAGQATPTVVTSEQVLSDARVESLVDGTRSMDAGSVTAVRELVQEAVDHIIRKVLARSFMTP